MSASRVCPEGTDQFLQGSHHHIQRVYASELGPRFAPNMESPIKYFLNTITSTADVGAK